jgi:hypothetical protein
MAVCDLGIISLLVVLVPQRLRPRRRYRWEPMRGCEGGDVDAAAEFPMVLAQIPEDERRGPDPLPPSAPTCSLTRRFPDSSPCSSAFPAIAAVVR